MAPSAPWAGSGGSLENRITLSLVRFSLPVTGPAGAVRAGLGGGGAAEACCCGWLPNTLLRAGAPPKGLPDEAWGAGAGAGSGAGLGGGGGAALATRLGLALGFGGGAGSAWASVGAVAGAAFATVPWWRVGMCR